MVELVVCPEHTAGADLEELPETLVQRLEYEAHVRGWTAAWEQALRSPNAADSILQMEVLMGEVFRWLEEQR